jgi:peptidoglycan/LPS O-acetylase OafA/YrhL
VTERPRRPELRALTGIRFWAAFAIYLYHADPIRRSTGFGRAVQYGPYAVSFFFVLSGFVLAYVYENRGAVRDRRAFWIARLARVYPVYLLGILIALPLVFRPVFVAGVALPTPDVFVPLAANLVMMQAWFRALALSINGVNWSLGAEAFFYAIFPMLLPAIAKRPRAALWLASAVSLALAMFVLTGLPFVASNEARAFLVDRLAFHPLARLPEFVIGVAAGCLFIRPSAAPSLDRSWALSAGIASIVIATAAAFAGHSIENVSHSGLLAPVFALLVAGLARGRGIAARFLAARPSVALGDLSYTLYIIHEPVGDWYDAFAHATHAPGTITATGFFIRTAITLALTVAIHVTVERPARRWIRARCAA